MRSSLASALGIALFLTLTPLNAQQTVRSRDLELHLTADGGITGLAVYGRAWPLVEGAPSGLLLRDAAADGEFVRAGGTLTPVEGGVRQSGINADLGLDFEATYRPRAGAIEVAGFIHDPSGRDRAITVRFSLPVDAVGGTWWNDLLKRETIAGAVYQSVRGTGVGATGSTSAYPWGAVSAELGEICLGIPMDRFVVHRISYDGQARVFNLDFDFGLSPLTKAFPSRADFSFVIYAADPAWGFRSATAGYYRLFPDAFIRRSEKEGLWMPFTDISKVENPEDFNFAYQEGAPNIPWDDAHDILSFRYISPHWGMLWMPQRHEKPTPEFIEQKLAEDLNSGDAAVRKRAQLIINSGAKNAQGKYHYTIGQAHWAPHDTGELGWYAMYPANADPDLAQLGNGPTTGSDTMATVEREVERYSKPGAFLDGFYFDGVDERPLDNYATEHFQFAEAPLTFATDTERPILCGAFSSYKFLKRVAEKMRADGRFVIANGVPSQFPFSAAFLDAGGAEREPSIESRPVGMEYLTYARTLMYRKPVLILYKPRLEERLDRDLSPYLVDYMHECLPYAAEPSMFMIFSNTDPAFYHRFWERPDWYNRYRPIFIDYVPVVKRLALAGWEPIPYATASDPSIVVERFGSYNLHIVAYNPAREGDARSFDLDVNTIPPAVPDDGKPRAGSFPLRSIACAVNLIDGTAVATEQRPDGGVRVHLTLPPRRAAVLAFAPFSRELAGFDLGEAAHYVAIAEGRLKDMQDPRGDTNFEIDPGDTGTPLGFIKYTEGDVTLSSDQAVCHSAPRATRAVLTGKARAVQSTVLPVQPGRAYRFSMWGRAEFPTTGSLHFYVRWRDGAGKDLGGPVNSAAIAETSDWRELTLDTTAPDGAATAMLALVGTRSGEGAATVWFDDPAAAEVGEQARVLLPVPPVVPTAAAERLATALKQRAEQVQVLVAESARIGGEAPRPAVPGPAVTGDGAKLCSQVLETAQQVTAQAEQVRTETPELGGVAAALDVCSMRLRRAGGILAGWRMEVTGGGLVARGEQPRFEVRIHAGAVALHNVGIQAPAEEPVTAPAISPTEPFSLEPGESRLVQFSLPGTGEGGHAVVIAGAEVAGGGVLNLRREVSYSIVSPCETTLADLGPAEDGRVQNLLLTARNTRRERPLAIRVSVTPPRDCTASVTEQTAEIKPGAELAVPITLTAAADAESGWREATVRVTWEGGQQSHHKAWLYLPGSANLLSTPGFEQTLNDRAAGWAPYGTAGGYALDTQTTHSGQAAIRATGEMAGASQRIVLDQTVARPLVLRGWSRYQPPQAAEVATIGMTEQAPTATQAARTPNYSLYVDLHYVGGGALYGQVATFDKGVDGWQFSERIISVPKPIKDVTLYLLFRDQSGTAWFDDVFLAEAEPNLALQPGVSVTTDSTYNNYTPAPLIDGVTDTTNVPWDKAAWASEDAKGEHWVELSFPQEVTARTVLVHWAVDMGATWTARDYAIQAFVNGAWQDVASVSGQQPRNLSVAAFSPVRASRLRVVQRDGGGNAARPNIMWLREIEVY